MSTYTIPNVIAEHPRGDRIMDVYSHLLAERIVYLGTAIDPGVANTLTAQLIYLEARSPDQEINLYINCEGGDMTSMLAVYDTMRFIQAPVYTTCVGQAIAAGAVLLAAGAPGHRLMLPHARILMHQGSAGIGGSAVEVELQAADLRQTRDTVLGLIAEDTGQPFERIFEDSRHDHWYSATEARDYGFVDAIAESFGQVMPSKKHPFGLRAPAGVRQNGEEARS